MNLMGLSDIESVQIGIRADTTRPDLRGFVGAGDALTTAVIIQACAGYIQHEQTQQPKQHSVQRSFMWLLDGLFICFPGPTVLRVRDIVNKKVGPRS